MNISKVYRDNGSKYEQKKPQDMLFNRQHRRNRSNPSPSQREPNNKIVSKSFNIKIHPFIHRHSSARANTTVDIVISQQMKSEISNHDHEFIL